MMVHVENAFRASGAVMGTFRFVYMANKTIFSGLVGESESLS